MHISSPRIKWVANHNQRRRDDSNLGGRQTNSTNRKCIFGNDLLQGTQSNVGFSAAAVAVGFCGHN